MSAGISVFYLTRATAVAKEFCSALRRKRNSNEARVLYIGGGFYGNWYRGTGRYIFPSKQLSEEKGEQSRCVSMFDV